MIHVFKKCHIKLFKDTVITASESKAEMKAALWRLPCDFDSGQADDQSTHPTVRLVCNLDNTDYGDMKRSV